MFGFEVGAEEMASVTFTRNFGLTGPMSRLYRHSNAFCLVLRELRWLRVGRQRKLGYPGHDLGTSQIVPPNRVETVDRIL